MGRYERLSAQRQLKSDYDFERLSVRVNAIDPKKERADLGFVTFDEEGTMYAALQGPGVSAGSTNAAAFTHYSLLAAIEDRYGLPRLMNAASATPLPI